MTPDRWKRISQIYDAALAYDPAGRAAFVASQCADDPDLRREVDSLLNHDLASAPAMSVVVTGAAAARRGSGVGLQLGAYLLESLLGEGGMGEVYRARDTALGRDVAIKILPPFFGDDTDRRARFDREARVLASLNHPNIGAIYGVAEGTGVRGLVLELVEGETLAERLDRASASDAHSGRILVDEVLAIARQLAEALDAAHERGVVHRDFKPANIKITPDGIVKVLDFGLAKAVSSDTPLLESTAPTREMTNAGVILGTTTYMSPEQARGRPVDKRTDIWAFGCVLYEMLTGRVPFPGDTMSDIVAAILEREPDWTIVPRETPSTVGALVRRCLEKNPKRRLRDIGEAIGALSDESAPQAVETPGIRIPLGNRERLMWAVALVLMSVAAATLWRPASVADAPPIFPRVVRVTNGPGLEFGPAVSPDGTWVAYFANTRGPIDIWVKFLSGGTATNLTADSGLELPTRIQIGGLAISPDGTRIAFDAGGRPGTPANLFDSWVIAAPLGGVPRKLVERGRSVRWSPDGTQITYVRAGAAAGDSLYVANADGTNEQLAVGIRGGMHVHWPAWSADGRHIYFIYSAMTANGEPSEIYRVASTGGRLEPVVSTARRALFPAPMADGIGLLYTANPLTAEVGLWWKSLASDAPARPVTAAVGEYADLTVNRLGGVAVASLMESREALAVLPMGGGSGGGQLRTLTDGFTGDQHPTVSPRGDAIVFASTRDGSRNLWRVDANGRNPRPLTSGSAFDERPSFSPDGQQIAFVSDRGGQRGLWIMNADGGAPRLVTQAIVLDNVSWSPDGRELVYSTPVDQAPGLWVVTVETGALRKLATPGPAISPVWCPRGDLIAYVEAQPPADGRPNSSRIAFVTRDGAPVTPGLLDSPNVLNGFLAWAHDGRHLAAFVEPGASSSAIWILDSSGVEPPKRAATLPPEVRIRGASWWPDGSTIVLGQIQWTSDIVLFEQ